MQPQARAPDRWQCAAHAQRMGPTLVLTAGAAGLRSNIPQLPSRKDLLSETVRLPRHAKAAAHFASKGKSIAGPVTCSLTEKRRLSYKLCPVPKPRPHNKINWPPARFRQEECYGLVLRTSSPMAPIKR